jgi:hypothetical protein
MHHFCTYFDRNYLTRGLALHGSLVRHCRDFQLWILAMDPVVESVIRRLELPKVRLVTLAELEGGIPELLTAKGNRSTLEYYFTCTPALPVHILAADASVDRITYLDADLWFYSDPAVVFDEIGDSPIAVVEHRFSPRNTRLEPISGRFNVSWVTFRRGSEGERCLGRWLSQCLNWCYNRSEGGLNADQKYLDEWPGQYPGLRILSHPGAGIAPWNVETSNLSWTDGRIFAGGAPLVFYHFHGVRRLGFGVYDPVLFHFFTRTTPMLRNHVYGPYLRHLEAFQHLLKSIDDSLETLGHLDRSRSGSDSGGAFATPLWLFRTLRSVLRREYLFYPTMARDAADLARELSRFLGRR